MASPSPVDFRHFRKTMMFDPRTLLAQSWAYSGLQRLLRRDVNPWEKILETLRIAPGMRILDIGCGPADVLEVLPEAIDYHGFDLEPNYIAQAKARHGSRGNFEVRAVSPDAVEGLGSFDLIMAIGVLHHLTDAEVEVVMAGAAKVLKPGGRLVTFDGVFIPWQNPIAKALLHLDRGRFVRSEAGYTTAAAHHFGEVQTKIYHDILRIPYTHIIMESADPIPFQHTLK